MDRYPHPAALDDKTLLAECGMRRQRRAGPGGQHRNKVETAVLLTHLPTGVSSEATERRSQAENRGVAVRRLRINLAIEIRRGFDAGALPSDLWQARCISGRIRVSPNHADFAPLLAEALDTLAGTAWDVSQAASHLDCTTSQLLKLLKLEPRAFTRLNDERLRRGLRRLK